MINSLKVVAALLICFSLAGCRQSKSLLSISKENKSPVIVEINGEAEHLSTFERFIKSRLADFADQSAQSQAEVDEQRSRLLDEFVRRQLILQEAVKKNIEPTDEEIRRALEEQHKQTSTQTPEQNVATLEAGERRDEIFNDLLSLKFYETEVLKSVKVAPQEVEEYYKAHADLYQGKNGFLVREIRVFEAAQAQQLYKQALAKPADFGVLAKQHSEAPTKENGGLIYYEAQQLPKVLEQAITPLKVGSISPVVQSNYGFHLFKLERRAEPLPIEKVQKEIEDKLLSEKNQALIDQFNKRALEAAKINIYREKLGFKYVGSLSAGS